LDEVVLRALEKNPALRYAQAGALKTDVETIATAEQLSSAPSRFPQSTVAGHSAMQGLKRFLAAPAIEPSQRAARIQAVERNIVLPVRLVIIVCVGYFIFFAGWLDLPNTSITTDWSLRHPMDGAELARFLEGSTTDWSLRHSMVLRGLFVGYVMLSMAGGAVLIRGRHLTFTKIEWIVFCTGLLDCILMGTLSFLNNGYDTRLYLAFAVLILHNALTIPLAFPQLLLNFLTIGSFMAAGILDRRFNFRPTPQDVENIFREKPLERVTVLIAWAFCCYGIQTLFEKQKRSEARRHPRL
jgi:hypothetical protein